MWGPCLKLYEGLFTYKKSARDSCVSCGWSLFIAWSYKQAQARCKALSIDNSKEKQSKSKTNICLSSFEQEEEKLQSAEKKAFLEKKAHGK